jgi:hypothetical protein
MAELVGTALSIPLLAEFQFNKPLEAVNRVHATERRRPRRNVNLGADPPKLVPLGWSWDSLLYQ